jgi:hypothetical protein
LKNAKHAGNLGNSGWEGVPGILQTFREKGRMESSRLKNDKQETSATVGGKEFPAF